MNAISIKLGFSKLQDTMGEEVKSKPFIDRLNRIEELGILYKNDWMDLRKVSK